MLSNIDLSFLAELSEHALHGKRLQKQKSIGKLVSCQERKMLFVPLINKWSTAGFVPPAVSLQHALHYKVLQGTLVSSDVQRALFVPLIIGYQQSFNYGFCPLIGLNMISLILVSRRTTRRSIQRKQRFGV